MHWLGEVDKGKLLLKILQGTPKTRGTSGHLTPDLGSQPQMKQPNVEKRLTMNVLIPVTRFGMCTHFSKLIRLSILICNMVPMRDCKSGLSSGFCTAPHRDYGEAARKSLLQISWVMHVAFHTANHLSGNEFHWYSLEFVYWATRCTERNAWRIAQVWNVYYNQVIQKSISKPTTSRPLKQGIQDTGSRIQQ